jgi:hypothetical protein
VPWTVRKGHADGPARSRGQSVKANRTTRDEPGKWTVRKDQADRPHRIWTVRYRSSDRPQTDCNKNLKQNRIENKGEQEHDKHAKNWAEHAPRGQSARQTRTIRALRTEVETARPRGSTPPTHHRISQTVEAKETRVWGQYMRQTRMLYPKNFAS